MSWLTRWVRTPLVAALLLGFPGAAAGDDTVQQWKVDPGTTAVLVEDHRVPLVFVAVDFPAGAWSAWARGNGAEEAFEIQVYDSKTVLRSRADDLGMKLELHMGQRSSRLAASIETEHLAEALALVGKILRNRDIDRHRLERWQKTRLLNWEEALRDPQFVLARATADLLFAPGDSRRLSWDVPARVVDNRKSLLAVRDELVSMPGRMIGLAGDLDRKRAEEVVRGLLPPPVDRSSRDLAPVVKGVPAAGEGTTDRTVTMGRINQVHVAAVRRSLADTSPQWSALLIADHVLGGHETSRLAEGLRRTTGSAHGARTVNRGSEDEGSYSLTAYSRTDDARKAEGGLLEVLRRFHSKGITEAERRSAAGFLRGRRLFARQSPRQIMNSSLYELRRGRPIHHREQALEAAAGLPLEHINAFIEDFYDPAGFTVIRVVPE